MSLPVAVVVVSWNSAAVLDRCLDSLSGVSEIVVVDNASSDDSCRIAARHAPRVRLIANSLNRGFAAAANQGVSASSQPLVLLLNPDAELMTDLGPMTEQLRMTDQLRMTEQLRPPTVGAVGGQLVGEDGRPQTGFNLRREAGPVALAFEALLVNRLWPGNPVNRRYRCLDLDHSLAQDIEQPAGAFLLVRRDVLQAVGGFDEAFFPLWFEDVDLCRRIRRAGYRIRYEPRAVARHRGAHSLERISLEQRQVYWYGSLLRYADKHFGLPARVGVRVCLLGGALLRSLGALGSGGQWRVYAKVISLALRPTAAATRQVQPHVLS